MIKQNGGLVVNLEFVQAVARHFVLLTMEPSIKEVIEYAEQHPGKSMEILSLYKIPLVNVKKGKFRSLRGVKKDEPILIGLPLF